MDIRRIEIGERTAQPRAGVEDHHIGLAQARVRLREEIGDHFGVGRVGGEGDRAGFVAQAFEFFDIAGGQATFTPTPQDAGDGGADAGPAPTIRAV